MEVKRMATRNQASMRPRLLHLGYDHKESHVDSRTSSFNEAEAFTPRILYYGSTSASGRDASMRPRLLHLGYHAEMDGAARKPHSFNEAEAFTPRIPRGERPSTRAGGRFNEAEAFTPRIPC